MRLFIAFDPPVQFKKRIIKSISPLVSNIDNLRWVREENLHLTLKFIGNIGADNKIVEAKLKEIRNSLNKTSKNFFQLDLEFDSFGIFRNRQVIIWLGIKENKELETLVKMLDKEMEKIGIQKEKRKYSPHITIGKGKNLTEKEINNLHQLLEKINLKKFPPFNAPCLTLMESILNPKGAIYKPLDTFPFLNC